jgi:hypothetical protein
MDSPKILMLELAEEVAVNVLVRHIPGIQAVRAPLTSAVAASPTL